MKEMQKNVQHLGTEKTEKDIIQLYMDYITKDEGYFVSECFENKHI